MQGLEIRITHFRFWYSVGIQKLPNRFVYISATPCLFRNISDKQKQIDIFVWKKTISIGYMILRTAELATMVSIYCWNVL